VSLCTEYVLKRGLSPEALFAHGVEFDEQPDRQRINERLGEDFIYRDIPLSQRAREILWFPVPNSDGVTISYTARPLPGLENGPKFLTPKGGTGLAYIPKPVYEAHGKAEVPIVITEGPMKALVCLQAGVAAIGLNGVWGAGQRDSDGKFVLRPELSIFEWRSRKVYIGFDADASVKPEVRHAMIRLFILLAAQGAEVYQFTSWDLSEGKGVDDYLAGQAGLDTSKHKEIISMLLADSVLFVETLKAKKVDLDAVESELFNLRLPELFRDQLCKELAKLLKVRVAKLRRIGQEENKENKNSVQFDEGMEPWPEPIDGEHLLSNLRSIVLRHVVLGEDGATAVALWIVLTYIAETVHTLPILGIYSPEKRCGKTTLIGILSKLVCKPLATSSISAAALFRVIEKYCPTLLVDEADSFLKENEELRGILNSGHTRHSAFVLRVDKDCREVERFSTWSPKAIALIGKLPPTLHDRCIPIQMARRTSAEKIASLRRTPLMEFEHLRREIVRWVADNCKAIGQATPNIPEGLNDRAADNWAPLLAIAQAAGGPWPDMALRAALRMSCLEDDEDSIALYLLASLSRLFQERKKEENGDFVATEDLLKALNEDNQAPWADWNKGLTARKLWDFLKPFDVKPVRIQKERKKVKGYRLRDLEPVFARYLSPDGPVPPPSSQSSDAPPTAPTSAAARSDFSEPESNLAQRSPNIADVSLSSPPSEIPSNRVSTNLTGSQLESYDGHHCEIDRVPDTIGNTIVSPVTVSLAATCNTTDTMTRSSGEGNAKEVSSWVGLDLETYAELRISVGENSQTKTDPNALNPWKAKIRLISLASADGRLSQLDLRNCSDTLPAEIRCEIGQANVIVHNALFDLTFLAVQYSIEPKNIFCTLTAARLLSAGLRESNQLGPVLKRYLDIKLSKKYGDSDWGGLVLTEEQLRYNKDDVCHLHKLKGVLESELATAELIPVFELETKLIPVVIRMRQSGIAVDLPHLKELSVGFGSEKTSLTQELRAEFGDLNLNPNSRNELLKAFARHGCELSSTDESSLAKCGHPLAAKVLQYRAAAKLTATAKDLLEAATFDGRVHPEFNPLGAESGRFSCTSPPIQTIPRGALRECFIASNPDRRLVVADYSLMELRAVACITQDTLMLEAFRAGEDLHRATAAAILNKDPEKVTGQDRQLAKAVNFGFIYGQNSEGFLRYARTQYGIELTLAEAEEFRRVFFTRYEGLRNWHRAAHEQASDITEGRTLLGRRRLANPDDEKKHWNWNRFQLCTNHVVQGSCADALKLAMVRLDNELPADAHIAMCIHDELVLDVSLKEAQELCELTQQVMETAFQQVFQTDLPVIVEAKICTNWGEK
jgi:DNA polymerase I-like protein with 3'-5' exonuclease and polymerase domains